MNDFNRPPSDPYQPRFTGVSTMMRLPFAKSLAGLDIAFIGVPYDMGTFFRAGARQGPSQIREMSRFIRATHTATGVAPFKLCQVADVGDAPVNAVNIEGSIERIADYYADVAAAGVAPLSMGGDHTIPVPILRGLSRGGAFDAPIGMIHIDAHADVLDTRSGAFDGYEVNHGTFVRLAVEEGLVDPKRTITLGLRGTQYSPDANDFAVEAGIRLVYQHEFDETPMADIVAEIRRVVGNGPTYFTIDVDGLDPVCCPGTGYPEPGGITMREMQAIMRGCRGLNIIGGDVCEVAPPFDQAGMTALNAAHMLFDMLCLIAEARTSS